MDRSSFLIWFVAFTLGIATTKYFQSLINLPIYNELVKTIFWILFYGLIIELVSRIMQKIVFNRKIKINLHFLFWIVIQSLCFLVGSTIVGFLDDIITILSYRFLFFTIVDFVKIILMGLFQTLLIKFTWGLNLERKLKEWFRKGDRRERRNRKIIIISLILLVLGFLIFMDAGGIRTKAGLILVSSQPLFSCELALSTFDFSDGFSDGSCKYLCNSEGMSYGKQECVNDMLNCYCKRK